MLRMAARLVLPLALVVTAYIFWRGHNLPGGGFIAGLVTAVALVLQYMALGQERPRRVLHAGGGTRYTRWIGIGPGHRRLTGVGAFVFGRPFLTSATATRWCRCWASCRWPRRRCSTWACTSPWWVPRC
jgi:multicomponent K+:H+ antiporter subunit A